MSEEKLFWSIYNFFNSTPFLKTVAQFLANPLLYILIFGLILYFSLHHDKKGVFIYLGLAAFSGLILSRTILAELLKLLIHRPRPFAYFGFTPLIPESGFAFPSGHASFLFGVSFFVYFKNKKLGVFYLIMSLLNGLARVGTGVHWPFDILGGIIIGFIAALITRWLEKRYTDNIHTILKRLRLF